jgi:hypothetical protein
MALEILKAWTRRPRTTASVVRTGIGAHCCCDAGKSSALVIGRRDCQVPTDPRSRRWNETGSTSRTPVQTLGQFVQVVTGHYLTGERTGEPRSELADADDRPTSDVRGQLVGDQNRRGLLLSTGSTFYR